MTQDVAPFGIRPLAASDHEALAALMAEMQAHYGVPSCRKGSRS